MNITLSVSQVNIDVPAHLSRLESDRLWIYAAQQWHRLYYPYIPYQTGTLAGTVRIEPGQITHTVPYAHRIYEGRFRFNTDQHPLASRQWDKAAATTQLPKLERLLKDYIERRII